MICGVGLIRVPGILSSVVLLVVVMRGIGYVQWKRLTVRETGYVCINTG